MSLPLLLAALPLLDALLAIVRRIRRGASPFHGDRFHFYDLLLVRGWPPQRVALISYGITAALALIGWATAQQGKWQFLLAATLPLGALLIAALKLGVMGTNAMERSVPEQSALEVDKQHHANSETSNAHTIGALVD